ncbi:MAG: hypothetical protein AAFQ19_09270 [Pseudomonadota bacterium]
MMRWVFCVFGLCTLHWANPSLAQGISNEPVAVREIFPEADISRGGFTAVPINEFFAGIHLRDTAVSNDDAFNPDAFFFGPVSPTLLTKGAQDTGTICVYVEAVNGGYHGHHSYDVTGTSLDTVNRPLKTEYKDELAKRYNVDAVVTRATLEKDCRRVKGNTAILTGLTDTPDRLEVILALDLGGVEVVLKPSQTPEQQAQTCDGAATTCKPLTCEGIKLPRGFRCHIALSALDAGLHELTATIQTPGKNTRERSITLLVP